MEIKIKGHSGCQIDVVKDNDGVYLYKSTADVAYLNRLVIQAKKQKAAAEVVHQNVRIPNIYDIQENSDSTILKMEYIYSKNFIEFFEQIGFEQVDYFIEALESFVEYEISKSQLQKVSPQLFQDKFAEIKNKVESNILYQDNHTDHCNKQIIKLKPHIQTILDRSQKIFDNLDEMVIPVGTCHGDLTFSNILFNGNNYYLIDFLDSFIETPLQDIVKIRQDTAYLWSQLMYTKVFDSVRLRIICDKMDYEIDNYFKRKYQWYTDHYSTLQLMNILRIFPYAHEEKVINFLGDTLNGILDEMENKTTKAKRREVTISEIDDSVAKRTLIMPIGVNKPEYNHCIPSTFQMAEDGSFHCIKALLSLDTTKFDKIFITIPDELNNRYSLSELLNLQFRIKDIKNAQVVVLDKPSLSQPDTIYQTICKMNIKGSIFIKDADCSFVGDDSVENAIVIYPLEELDWVNPRNKSYVNIDDMYYITNVIEKRVVSSYFTAGGYCFENSETYCHYYERFIGQSNLYLSHIIFSMMLDKQTFRPIMARVYNDFDLKH